MAMMNLMKNIDKFDKQDDSVINKYRYDFVRAIVIHFLENPQLPVIRALEILEISSPTAVSNTLNKSGVKTLENLQSLTREQWVPIPLHEDTKRDLTKKLAFVQHYNRFEQQSKSFYHFVLTPNFFVFFSYISIIISFAFILLHMLSFSVDGFESRSFYQYNELFSNTLVIPAESFPIYIYYTADSLYQNYRTYLASVSFLQLSNGDLENTGDCEPFDALSNPSDSPKKIVYPCGQTSYSYFNDRFIFKLFSEDLQKTFFEYSDGKEQSLIKNRSIPSHDLMRFVDLSSEFSAQIASAWLRKTPNNLVEEIATPRISSPEFINWMSFAVAPNAFKLYGVIHAPEGANAKSYSLGVKVEKSAFDPGKGYQKQIVILGRNNATVKNDFLFVSNIIIVFMGVIGLVALPFLDLCVNRKSEGDTVKNKV